MADQKISDLNAATALADGDEVELLQSGVNKRADVGLLGGRAYELIAANDAPAAVKARADRLCNGTDDNVEINAAIDALPADGGTIELSSGTFSLDIEASTDAIDFANDDKIHIKGQGPGSTILQMGVASWRSVIRGDQADFITISDLTIDGNKSSFAGNPGIGIRFLSASANNVIIENVEIKNTDEAAISYSGSDVWVRDCYIHDCDGGVRFNTSSANVFLLHNIIKQVGVKWTVIADAVFFGGRYLTAIGNYIEEGTDTGINIGGSTDPTGWAKVIGNTILLCGNSGINTGGGDHQTIIGNTIFACGRKDAGPRSNSGIRIRDDGGGTFSSKGVVVAGNICYEDDTTYALDSGALGMENGIEVVNASGGGDPDELVIVGNDLTVIDAAPTGWTPILRTDMGASVVIRDNLGDVSRIVVRKAADETISNSNTLQDDNELLFAIGASETWRFEMVVFYKGETASDFQMAVTVPSGATMRVGFFNDQQNQVETTSGGTTGQFTGDGGEEMALVKGLVINSTTAGNVTFQWSQDIAVVEDTIVRANSYLVADRIEEAV